MIGAICVSWSSPMKASTSGIEVRNSPAKRCAMQPATISFCARWRRMNAARPGGVITITTDFGHQGPFVGVMKGAILSAFPTARIIDLTHESCVHWPAEGGLLARARI